MRFRALVLFCLLLAVAASLPAQVRLEPVPKTDAQERKPPVFRVPVNVVTTPVTVLGANGEFVVDLPKDDFLLTDNGVPQNIVNFELTVSSISLAVVVDTSSRVEGLLPNVRNSGILFTQLIMGQTGEAAVLTYDQRVEVKQDFTTDGDLVEKALKALQTGGEQSRLSDGIMRAVGMLKNRPEDRRKVIVVIAEGREFGSETTAGEALREAQLSNISIYTVGLSTVKALLTRPPDNPPPNPFPPGARPLPPGTPPTPSAADNYGGNVSLIPLIIELVREGKALLSNPLRVYAEGTGASHYGASSQRSIEEAVERIAREVHSQYTLAYNPNNLSEPEFHRIEVKVRRPGVTVRARPGYYYVPAPQGQGSVATDKPAPGGPPAKKKVVPPEKRQGPSIK